MNERISKIYRAAAITSLYNSDIHLEVNERISKIYRAAAMTVDNCELIYRIIDSTNMGLCGRNKLVSLQGVVL